MCQYLGINPLDVGGPKYSGPGKWSDITPQTKRPITIDQHSMSYLFKHKNQWFNQNNHSLQISQNLKKKILSYSFRKFLYHSSEVFKLTFRAHYSSMSWEFLTLDSMGMGGRKTFSLLGPLTGPRAKKNLKTTAIAYL